MSDQRATNPDHHYGTKLRESPYWTSEQYVDGAELAGAERRAFGEPAQVPIVHFLRREDRVWEPSDYGDIRQKQVHAPGYTLLRDVNLVSPGMALAADGRFVFDEHTRLNPKRLAPALERDLRVGTAGRREWDLAPQAFDRGILVAGAGLERFGHFLLDFLPGLALLDDFGINTDWPLLMPEQTPSWVEPMVEVFCGRPRRIERFSHRRDLRVPVGELCVPWVVRDPAFHPMVAPVFERVVTRLDKRDGSHPGGRICIVRTDRVDKRRLTNADAVLAHLKARGLNPVLPETMPFADQVRLFGGVELAVGEAGSGLHGTVFSPPGMLTLELRPPTYDVHGQTAIAVLRRHRFTSVVGDQPDDRRMSRAEWTLDLDSLASRLDELGIR